jgi:hypothetical protein
MGVGVMKAPNVDYKKLTFLQMANMIRAIWEEMKRRNPIGINFYGSPFAGAVSALEEIHHAEKDHHTCEAGPGID